MGCKTTGKKTQKKTKVFSDSFFFYANVRGDLCAYVCVHGGVCEFRLTREYIKADLPANAKAHVVVARLVELALECSDELSAYFVLFVV